MGAFTLLLTYHITQCRASPYPCFPSNLKSLQAPMSLPACVPAQVSEEAGLCSQGFLKSEYPAWITMAERPHKAWTMMVLALIIVSSGAPGMVQGSACNIYALASCLAYCKSYQVPSRACCNSLASLGAGAVGSQCLCSLMTSQVGRQYGVIPEFAIGMPYRCGLPVPWHETCAGTRVPGGW